MVDIGEDVPTSMFVKAGKEIKATVVGVSAISSLKPQCKAINDALIQAGIRDDVIYIVGGWWITQEWCDSMGSDAFGKNAVDALGKVKAVLSGDPPKWRDQVHKQRVKNLDRPSQVCYNGEQKERFRLRGRNA